MARTDNLTNFLTDVADAIRSKKGTSGKISASYFDTEIASITTGTTEDLSTELTTQNNLLTAQETTIDQIFASLQNKMAGGEISLQEKTISPTTSKQEVTADSGYDGLSKVTVNAIPTTTQATPSISVSSSGLITASSTQSAGYVSAGTKSATKQLTTKGATTWTPKTTNQTISSGTYLTGTQTIKGDSNLVASNIKSGVSIFGVAGSLEASVAEDLTNEFNDYENELTAQEEIIEDIITALQGKGTGGGLTPTGTLDITENGTYDVTNYASVNVNVESSSGNSTNIFDGTKLTFTNGDKVTATSNSIIFDNSASSSSIYYSSQNVASLGLKPSTVYSSRCTVTIETITSGGGSAGSMAGSLWLQKNSSYSSDTKFSVIGNNSDTGVVYSQFVTPSDLTGFNYLVNRTSGYCKTKFENIVLLEGIYDSGNFPV